MADLYGSTSQSPPPHESEDISTFLHHILHASPSSSSTTPFVPFKPKPMLAPPILSPAPEADSGTGSEDFHRFNGIGDGNRIESSLGLNLSDPGFKMISDSDANASPRRRGFSAENDLGDFSCDSEGTGGASEVQLNPGPWSSRSSSKRTRAAEVHNQSEKRRRSRINEKMKALQNLIPNSNKTDKASMLDEAIEYLKQLQLQVQMLSMRNGISLHPMCIPGVLQSVQLSQLGMEFDEGNGLLNSNREARPFPANQERLMQAAFGISHQNTSNLENNIPSSSTDITNSETPFGFEQVEYEPFNLPAPPKEMCKEVTLPQHTLELIGSGNNSSSSKQ